MTLAKLSPFAFKLLLLVVAIVAQHFGLLSPQLGTLLALAIGGAGLTSVMQAWQATDSPAQVAHIASSAKVHDALASLVGMAEKWVASVNAQTQAVTANVVAAGPASPQASLPFPAAPAAPIPTAATTTPGALGARS